MLKDQKGFSLLITFLVMTTIIAIVLGVSAILVNEIKIIGGIDNSVVSFYAADSGIEKTLYFDRKLLVSGAPRGLCNICAVCKNDQNDSNGDLGSHCNSCTATPLPGFSSGCDPATCNNCQINYISAFLSKNYSVSATVSPDANPSFSDLNVLSRGAYIDTARQIQLNSQLTLP